MSNVYAAEQAILDRIKDKVDGLAEVGSVSKLATYQEDDPPSPSVYVQPSNADAIGDPDDGSVQQENQTWEITVCVENIADVLTDDYDTTAKRAGEILFQVQQALVGWRPAKNFKPFAYRGRPEPYFEPGYAEFPALFETGFLITGID